MSAFQTNPFNIAICMGGQFRVSGETVESFHRYVYDELLTPDVFVSAREFDKNHDAQRLFKEFTKRLELRTSDPMYEQEVNDRKYSKCMDNYKNDDRANWIQGWPNAYKGTNGTGFRQVYGWEQCGRMVRSEEKIRGYRYTWVIFTRSDFIHVAPHPLFTDRTKTYIPRGMDWAGINDRHAVHPRHHADIRFDIHRTLLEGKFDCSWLPPSPNLEMFLHTLLVRNNIPVERYTPTAYLACLGDYCTKPYKYEGEYLELFQ